MIWRFSNFAKQVSIAAGAPWAFMAAAGLIIAWLISGPLTGFSDTWQLVINTTTTIITFLMVFLIQSSQNRDARALHLKLDELICSIKDARLELVDAEDLREEELDRLQREFSSRRDAACHSRKLDPETFEPAIVKTSAKKKAAASSST